MKQKPVFLNKIDEEICLFQMQKVVEALSNLLRLSLCMIVKNEEDCIGRCLKSVEGVVDEIIIVDTGSTDRTVEICQSFGAKVYSFPWNESFADARNYGIEQATGDWILWLDADEEVDEQDRYKLRDALYLDSSLILNVRLINYFGEEANKDQVLTMAHPRLFRNQKDLRFVGKIHETLVLKDKSQIGFVDINVYHYGYLTEVVGKKDKVSRNLSMLQRELQENENTPWIHYHIATEYTRLLEFKKAFHHLNTSIAQFIEKGQMPPSFLYKLKYTILINTGSWDGAWPGIERAVTLYPDYVDLRFFMGFILCNKKMYRKAIKAFEACIELGEENINYLTLKGFGSFYAWYYKGLCHQKLNQLDEAIFSFLQAIHVSDTFTPALDSLVELQEDKGVSLEDYLGRHFDEDAGNDLLTLIQSHEAKGKEKRASLWGNTPKLITHH